MDDDFFELIDLTFEELKIPEGTESSDHAVIRVLDSGEQLAFVEGVKADELTAFHFFPFGSDEVELQTLETDDDSVTDEDNIAVDPESLETDDDSVTDEDDIAVDPESLETDNDSVTDEDNIAVDPESLETDNDSVTTVEAIAHHH
ncbi:MAG: hypothetical protein F6K23_21790 [Okeania sp. SIO2C9]|uniref:hypothetical protein n=1 Tax=Okeania sp. SIO2C9 TaxID=2607791 RepID=UPI0013C1B98F|nr:hypothetical protein [Okeania sp. SIO2C9]NEQ75451.1 hypothetical protein [Okeania sp. SIO2C9]